jgi:penicillin amidase
VPEIDKALRTLNVRRAAAEIVRQMPEETRLYMQAFVDGVNFYQREMDDLPPEFGLLALAREAITVEDIVAISRVAGVDINWFTTIGLMRLRDNPDFDKILDRLQEAGSGPTVSFDNSEQSAMLDILNANVRSGSNSFAVSGARSASGSALIASDPHLGVTQPNLWLIAGISSPSYKGVGLMIPGTPFLALGRTETIAWGGTNMRAAHSEFYDVSKLPASAFEETTSRVKKRLWFSGDVKTRWAKGYGAVMSDTLVMQGATRPGETVAIRWIGHEVTDEITAILKAARARSAQEFREALKTFALPAQNMVYADTDGNIAQVTATMLPRRPYTEFPRSVVLEAKPGNAWKEILNATQLPWALNPAEGFVASANNKPYDNAGDVPPGFFFSADERIRRIREMLSADASVTIAELKRMQTDTISPFAREMIPALKAAIEEADAGALAPAFTDRLLAFDGDYRVDSAGAPAFEIFLFYLAPLVYGVEKADNIPFWAGNWNGFGKVFAGDLSRMQAQARISAVRDAVIKAAPDAARFATWGEMHRLQVSHYLSAIPALGGNFVYANVPTAGSRETVFKSAHGFHNGMHNTRYGSQSRHISDMADPDANWFILLGGNDGWLGSENFIDQVALWQRGEYIRMPMRPETVAAEFSTVMALTPAK